MQGGQDTCCSTGRWGVQHCGVRVVSGLIGQGLCVHTPVQLPSREEVLCSTRLVRTAFSAAGT